MIKKILFILILLTLLLFFSCRTGDSSWETPDNICGQEPCYEGPFQPPWISGHDYGLEFVDQYGVSLSYDNRVLETENVLTFSDASLDWVKIEYARMTEVSFEEIKELFDIITSAELGITDLNSKLRIYSKRYGSHPQAALPSGFILYGLDSPQWGNQPDDDPEFYNWYQRMVKHETMHVVQFKLGGLYQRVWDWFTEGVAEHVSGGAFTPISCWPEVVEWRQIENHVNPVSVMSLTQIPQNTWGEHYPLFGLAVCYLLDPGGHNRSIEDVKAMFADIGNGMGFVEAFELHMGISLDYYEEHFWVLMQAYLPAECDDATRIRWEEGSWENFEDPSFRF
jgi:hypothetical protein